MTTMTTTHWTDARPTCALCGYRSGYVFEGKWDDDMADHAARYHGEPQVGDGVTMRYPQDSYGFVVVKRTATTITMERLQPVDTTTGHEPAYYDGPFPVWTHTYTDEERRTMRRIGDIRVARRSRKNGRWYSNGSPVSVDAATYHRNYSY